jgi:hypothetical protein
MKSIVISIVAICIFFSTAKSQESGWEVCNIEHYISKTDKEIDSLVYELYGLTKEKIEIIENG